MEEKLKDKRIGGEENDVLLKVMLQVNGDEVDHHFAV